MRIDHLTPEDWTGINSSPWIRLARAILLKPGNFLYRYRAYGHAPRVPESGGFLLAPAPHGAFLDPFVFGLGQPRTNLRFMAKYQALEWPIIGRIIRWGGGFPVHRGDGRSASALTIAEHVLRSGDGLVVFMEGRMVLEHDGLGVPRSGVARLALATGVPVVPVAGYGAKRARAYGGHWLRYRPKVTTVWGAPLSFGIDANPSQERVAEVTHQIWSEISRLFALAVQIHNYPGGRPPHATDLASLSLVGPDNGGVDGHTDTTGA
jgi:1-acyl-sn-glycerol-3-phosphate acyltransferase